MSQWGSKRGSLLPSRSEIAELVNVRLDAVTAIADGASAGAAKAVENVLSKLFPVVISLMVSLLGLGGISHRLCKPPKFQYRESNLSAISLKSTFQTLDGMVNFFQELADVSLEAIAQAAT